MRRPLQNRRGFTLIEILLSISLVALLMVGVNTFVFSMGEIWGRSSDQRLFDRHLSRVTRYLQGMLETAVYPYPGASQSAGIEPKEVRLETGMIREMLSFELPEGNRLMSWPEAPLPSVVCALDWRPEEGLVLLWHSRLERDFEDQAPRELVISPLVTGLVYDYYESNFDRWTEYPELQKGRGGELLVPQRLRLKFSYGGLTRETVVLIPAASTGVPLF